MSQPSHANPSDVLALLPSGLFLMTAAFEGKRGGTLVHGVQQCATEPLLIAVSARKGHGIEPIIRDSHCFAVCQIDPDDKLLLKKFAAPLRPGDYADLFDSLHTETLVSNAPVLKRSMLAIDCEVVRHFDMEADHELYIGRVLAAMRYGERTKHIGGAA